MTENTTRPDKARRDRELYEAMGAEATAMIADRGLRLEDVAERAGISVRVLRDHLEGRAIWTTGDLASIGCTIDPDGGMVQIARAAEATWTPGVEDGTREPTVWDTDRHGRLSPTNDTGSVW